MPRTAAFSSSLGRETVLIGAGLFFAMAKEHCGLFFMNWNLRHATAHTPSLRHHKKHEVQYLKLYNLLGDELKQFQLCLRFLVLFAISSTPFLHCRLQLYPNLISFSITLVGKFLLLKQIEIRILMDQI